jgi:rRNA-processing protein FCF1
MIPGMFGVDILSELERVLEGPYELLVPRAVVRELEQISMRGGPRERIAAGVGLRLVERGSVAELEGGADESILKLATQRRCVVGTTDASLRRELRRRGIPVIYLSQKSHLAKDGSLELRDWT